jgi:translation initiation factor 1
LLIALSYQKTMAKFTNTPHHKSQKDGIVYSTNPDFDYEEENEEYTPLEPKQQQLKLTRRKLKAGKIATVIMNFVGKEEEREALAKLLKSKCACGGGAKEGEILLQGDFLEKVKKELDGMGYKYKVTGV